VVGCLSWASYIQELHAPSRTFLSPSPSLPLLATPRSLSPAATTANSSYIHVPKLMGDHVSHPTGDEVMEEVVPAPLHAFVDPLPSLPKISAVAGVGPRAQADDCLKMLKILRIVV